MTPPVLEAPTTLVRQVCKVGSEDPCHLPRRGPEDRFDAQAPDNRNDQQRKLDGVDGGQKSENFHLVRLDPNLFSGLPESGSDGSIIAIIRTTARKRDVARVRGHGQWALGEDEANSPFCVLVQGRENCSLVTTVVRRQIRCEHQGIPHSAILRQRKVCNLRT